MCMLQLSVLELAVWKSKYLVGFTASFCHHINCLFMILIFWTFWTRVSNRMGQCNFSGQRARSSLIVPGQRDNGTSSKSCQGMGQTGRACQNLGRDAGRDGTRFWQPVPSRPVGQNGTEQKSSKTGKGRSKTGKDGLK